MAHDVRPTILDDLPELSQFLIAGFHTPADAPFAATDVLRWKYFDPRGRDAGDLLRSFVARDRDTGAIVGHVGLSPVRFHGRGLSEPGVSSLHMMDWLSTAGAAGVSLMRRTHQIAETQYGLGGSRAARAVGTRGIYRFVAHTPVFQRGLRPLSRLRDPSRGLIGRGLRVAKDVVALLRDRPRRPLVPVTVRQVSSFGAEVDEVLAHAAPYVLFTTREPAFLNHLLRYPRGGVTGWLIERDHRVRGMALLSLAEREGGTMREGRITECFIDDPRDADLWLAALVALTAQLRSQGADRALVVASTNPMAFAARAAGYVAADPLDFHIRDRANRLPLDQPVHLTFVEADYAYT